MSYSSFICERSVEFVLVPKLTAILGKTFSKVVPIAPWLTREGSTLSRTLHEADSFRVIGLYAKRPKIQIGANNMLIKINEEFVNGAREASKNQLPMIVGCPLVRNVWGMGQTTRCIWIKLDASTKSEYFTELESNGSNIQLSSQINILNDDEILTFVESNARQINFERFLVTVKNVRNANSMMRRFMNFGAYKPVYFLLKK